jgi:putative transposase
MSDKYKGKYRNESARLQNWDYGSNAAYFITICTNDREHFFGEINNNKMWISPAGAIAYVLWFEIKNHVKNIDLGEFIVMPNHIHGILILIRPTL